MEVGKPSNDANSNGQFLLSTRMSQLRPNSEDNEESSNNEGRWTVAEHLKFIEGSDED